MRAAGLLLWSILTATVPAACSAHPLRRLDESALPAEWAAVLRPGETTREDLRRALGEPSRVFADDDVVTYRLAWAAGGGPLPVVRADWERIRAADWARIQGEQAPPHRGWRGAQLSLVLAFDHLGILQESAVIAVR